MSLLASAILQKNADQVDWHVVSVTGETLLTFPNVLSDQEAMALLHALRNFEAKLLQTTPLTQDLQQKDVVINDLRRQNNDLMSQLTALLGEKHGYAS